MSDDCCDKDGRDRANKSKRKSKKDKPWVCGDPPQLVEHCPFCECFWGSNIKFYDISIKGLRKKGTRACEFCIFGMTLGLEGRPPIVGASSQVEAALTVMAHRACMIEQDKDAPIEEVPPPEEPLTTEENLGDVGEGTT
jgi:hypothetical protein